MSAVEVQILGNGDFAGAAANITDYDVTEDGTPLSISDSMGGVGGLSFGAVEDPSFNGSMLLPGQPFVLTDPQAGEIYGIIDNIASSDDALIDISCTSSLLPLTSKRKMPPRIGNLGSAILAYITASGIDPSKVQIDPSIAAKSGVLPAWDADVWTQLKRLGAIHGFEIAEVRGRILFRTLRQRQIDVQRYTSKRLDYGRTSASSIVEVYYYNNQYKLNEHIYPGKNDTDPNIIQVDAGETVVTNIPVSMWLTSVNQPTQVSYISYGDTVTTSTYAVVDREGRHVAPSAWVAGAGSVTYAIGEDGRSVDVTVRASADTKRGPFRIASSIPQTDNQEQFNALHIAGTGVMFDKKMIWAPTGASLSDASADDVTTIDDPLIGSVEEALRVRAAEVVRQCGFSQNLEVEATRVNRRGETGIVITPTFGEWDAQNPTLTFSAFDVANAGKTFGQFDAERAATVADDFTNQAFGGVGGARVRDRNAMYRVRQSRVGPGSFSWTAEPDTLFEDWEAEHADTLTFGQFDAIWAGRTFIEHARQPLYTGP